MTEAEWDACASVRLMLEFLRGKASDRQVRLFAVACCRRIWHRLEDERSRVAVELAERLAEGMATEAERRTVRHAAQVARSQLPRRVRWAAQVAYGTTHGDAWHAAQDSWFRTEGIGTSAEPNERAAQTGLLRDIIGPSIFRPIALNSYWLCWNDGAIPKMAQSMYEARDFSGTPILADMLEESGCEDVAILRHCREPGEHVTGCWVVDLLLGKK